MTENFPTTFTLLKNHAYLLVLWLAILSGQDVIAGQAEVDKQYQQAKTLKEFEEIAGKIKKLLAQDPGSHEWEWRLARSHYAIAKRSKDSRHYDLCIEHSNRSLEIRPTAIGYFFRALCRGKKGEMQGIWSSLGIIDPFEKDMKKALEMDPSIQSGGPNRALGKLYLELPFFLGGSTDQSIYHLKEAVRMSPGYAENHLGLAQAYYAKNNFIAARKSLSTLLSLTDNVTDDEDRLKIRTQGQELMKKIPRDFQSND